MTTAPQPLLEIHELYSEFSMPDGRIERAVSNVSLVAHENTRVGVVGESGSGKSQTFLGVFGLSSGSPAVVNGHATFHGACGKIELLGKLDEFVVRTVEEGTDRISYKKNVTRWNRHQRRALRPIMGHDVGFMFQDCKRSLIPYWKVGRQMQAVLERKGAGNHHKIARELLVRMSCHNPDHILKSYPQDLSGGEAQRVFLALTLGMQPRLLIADEPTTGLDTVTQAQVLTALLDVQRESRLALIFISHDLAIVSAVAEEIIVMFAGRIVERLSVELLRDLPSLPVNSVHPYTRALHDSQMRRRAGLPIVGQERREGVGKSSLGCPYQSRCARKVELPADVQERCATHAPELTPRLTGQVTACWGLV